MVNSVSCCTNKTLSANLWLVNLSTVFAIGWQVSCDLSTCDTCGQNEVTADDSGKFGHKCQVGSMQTVAKSCDFS